MRRPFTQLVKTQSTSSSSLTTLQNDNIVYLRDGDVVLYKRERSSVWQMRYRLYDKEWFWISDSGKINLAIKYGAKTLTLNKKTKANCIELNNGEELITTLKALKTDVLNGALDEAITEVSSATRRAFGK